MKPNHGKPNRANTILVAGLLTFIYSPCDSNLLDANGFPVLLAGDEALVLVGAALQCVTTLPSGVVGFPSTRHGVSRVSTERHSLVFRQRGHGAARRGP